MPDLRKRAAELWPDSPTLQERWVKATQYLIDNKLWVLHGGKAKWSAAS